MKRVIVVVIDSMGIGAMPDSQDYGDSQNCNTLKNVASAIGGLKVPNLEALGLGNLMDIKGINKVNDPLGQYAILRETSKGKDTTTGHWELMGCVLQKPFGVYPNGFDKVIIDRFIKDTNCGGILGNCAASGTKIIEDLHTEHEKTHFPIIYTSADSVFQIAVDIDIIPIEKLYDWCKIARKMLSEIANVSRVIARPYKMTDGKPTRISALRRDFSVKPTGMTACRKIVENNGIVLGIGKIEDIFVGDGISHAIHTGSNTEGLELTLKAIKNEFNLEEHKVNEYSDKPDKYFIFTNLVDTDMLYGHRNDAVGYAKAIEEIDSYIPEFIKNMTEEDLLMITADHGCDPTQPGTDHTREQVPLIIYSQNIKGGNLGTIDTFTKVADLTLDWLNK